MKCNAEFARFEQSEQIDLIMRNINENPELLPDVRLGAVVIHSGYSAEDSFNKLYSDILYPIISDVNCIGSHCQRKRILAGIVLGSSSEDSIKIARRLKYVKIPQVNLRATSTELDRFKYTFRTIPSNAHQIEALADLLTETGLNHVSVLYTTNAHGMNGMEEISKRFRRRGICVDVAHPLPSSNFEKSDALLALGKLVKKKEPLGVILLSTSTIAHRLLSVAASTSNTVNISWIFSHMWAENSWSQDLSYRDAIHESIEFSPKFQSTEELTERIHRLTIDNCRDEKSIRNPWCSSFLNCSTKTDTRKRLMWKADGRLPKYKFAQNELNNSILVFAHALHNWRGATCPSNSSDCEEYLQKAEPYTLPRELFPYIKDVTFLTADKTVFKFDENQGVPPFYDIRAFDRHDQDNILNGYRVVGTYNNKLNILMSQLPDKIRNLKSLGNEKCGSGYTKIVSDKVCCEVCQNLTTQSVPKSCLLCDTTGTLIEYLHHARCEAIQIEEMEYDSVYGIVCWGIGVCGFVFAVTVAIIYWKHRNSKIIGASDRELCIFILSGAVLTLLNCFTVTGHPSNISCAITRITMTVGPTAIYTTLLMRSGRIAFYYHSRGKCSTLMWRCFEPGPLFLVAVCLMLIQVSILAVWMHFSPPTDCVYYSENAFSAFHTCNLICEKGVMVGLAFQSAIIIICTILATVNRKVPTGYRESSSIRFAMYSTCIIWIAFHIFTNVDENGIERQVVALSSALSLASIIVLLCMFGPRCYTLLRHTELNTHSVPTQDGHRYPPADPRDVATASV